MLEPGRFLKNISQIMSFLCSKPFSVHSHLPTLFTQRVIILKNHLYFLNAVCLLPSLPSFSSSLSLILCSVNMVILKHVATIPLRAFALAVSAIWNAFLSNNTCIPCQVFAQIAPWSLQPLEHSQSPFPASFFFLYLSLFDILHWCMHVVYCCCLSPLTKTEAPLGEGF